MLLTSLMDAFRGYDGAHGVTIVTGDTDERGKAGYKSWTERKPVSEQEWTEHLKGTGKGLGIIPLLADNTLRWAAIDIDDYGVDHEDLLNKISQHNLKLMVFTSKSGGAHLFQFFSEPVKATIARKKMQEWAKLLGYGKAEVFPKQDTRASAEDLGNWLNMPFYNAQNPDRYLYGQGGKKLGVKTFLEQYPSHTLDEETLLALSPQQGSKKQPYDDKHFPSGPPCLNTLFARGGFPEGTRNDGMFAVAVYLMKRYGAEEDWLPHLQEYNDKMCIKPLPRGELHAIYKQVKNKGYAYPCRKDPIRDVCDKDTCKKCLFGVGVGIKDTGITLGDVTKREGDPVYWFLNVNDKRVQLTSEELMSFSKFSKKILDIHGFLPPVLPAHRWTKAVNDALENHSVIVCPPDTSHIGLFLTVFDNYCFAPMHSKEKEDIINNAPWHDGEGNVWFKAESLFMYLRSQDFKYPSEHQVWLWLEEHRSVRKEIIEFNEAKVLTWVAKLAQEPARKKRERFDDSIL